MKRTIVLTALATMVFLSMCLPAAAVTVVEKYTTAAAFKARLAGFPVKTVNFDGIKTGKTDLASFSATKYRSSTGLVITGEGGQYASRAFRSTKSPEFVAVSKRNTYAPGPVVWSGPAPVGGNETDVTFSAGGGSILAAGFGCYFIDADWPGQGPASFTAYGVGDVPLGGTGIVSTANAKSTFVGLVAVDSVTDQPVPAFARVHVVSGDGWLGNNSNEGVALDDFMAGTATYSVSGKVLRGSGKPVKGAKVALSGGFTTSTRTNAKGRFTIPNLPAGTYTVKPTKSGMKFRPVSRPALVVAGNLTLAKFVGR